MKNVEFWFWHMRGHGGKKIIKSPCRLTEAHALREDPTATRIEGSMKIIEVLEPGDPQPTWSNTAFKGFDGKKDVDSVK